MRKDDRALSWEDFGITPVVRSKSELYSKSVSSQSQASCKSVPMDDDFQEMLVSAERYALGRMTYIVSLTVDYISPLIKSLDMKYINIMIDDITGHSDLGYGMDMDEEEWEKLLSRLRAEKERRTNGRHG
ncbi:hypothetical protein [Dialister hominis]|uniref:Uncharacterized protein n=1 Tax=Dialister hominis TaxID=2582419 RepID=A0A8E4G0B8_9FIRM|nr:hypothetical protein [Dialister hominis]BBK24952.1 hypothetical protein Dia5BBH33_08870 [Dialister hominis]